MTRRKSPTTFNLFPFLAVLISTMGVLVVILLLVANDASQQSAAKEQAAQKKLDEEKESWQDKIDQLQAEQMVYQQTRDSLVQDLKRQQQDRLFIQKQNKELLAEAQRIGDRIKSLQNALKQNGDLEQVQFRIAEQGKKIQQLQKEVQSRRDKAKKLAGTGDDTRPVYSIVPIASVSGTSRRPIYIECRGDGVFLFPGNIKLESSDFLPPLTAGNPLDSALAAYLEFWQNDKTKSEKPYPLIVLRPSGAKWYGAVRKSMTSWADQFGYELVPEDWNLEYQQPEEGLLKAVKQSVEVARIRSEKLRYALARHRNQQRFGASGRNVASRGSSGKPAPRGSSPSNASRPGALPGKNNWVDVAADGSRPGNRIVAGSVDSRVVHSDGTLPRHLENASDPVALLSAGYHQPGTGGSVKPNRIGNPNRGLDGRLKTPEPASPFGPTPFPSAAGNSLASSQSLASTIQSHQNQQNSGRQANPFGRSSNSSGFGDLPSGASGSNQSGQGSSQGNSSGNQTAQNQAANGGAGSHTFGQAVAGQVGGDPSQSNSSRSKSQSFSNQPNSIAKSRGKNWALPAKRKISSAYFRPISVSVFPDKIVLASDAWQSKKEISTGLNSPFGGNSPATFQQMSAAMDPMIDQVWKRVEAWGSLGSDGYWKPVLKIRSAKGAESQVRWMQTLLKDSGLELEVVGK